MQSIDRSSAAMSMAPQSLLEQLQRTLEEAATLRVEVAHWKEEAEQWKREASRLQEVVRRMIDCQKTPREHVAPNQIQLAFERIAQDLLEYSPRPESSAPQDPQDPNQQQASESLKDNQPDEPKPKGPRNPTPHGRAQLPEHLPVETIVIEPKDLPADARPIGEDVSWKLGFRRASFYRLKIVRPRYCVDVELGLESSEIVARMTTTSASPSMSTEPQDVSPSMSDTQSQDAPEASSPPNSAEQNPVEIVETVPRPETTIIQATMPLEIIQRGLPTADMLAHVIVGKFADGLPFNRQSSIFEREGVHVTRSTMCQWTGKAHTMVSPLVTVMGKDACHHADVIATDGTGVLVQANERCKKGCFTVYVSNNGHVIFRYSKHNSSDEPNEFLAEFNGTILADATATLDAICRLPDIYRAGCHSHARRYFYKSIATDRDRGLVGLGLYNRLFKLERTWTDLTPDARLAERQLHSRPVFDGLVAWCHRQLPLVDERTPIRAALFYTINNLTALERFLHDGRVVIHNNRSELELRRLVVGRAAWLFVGSDDTAPWTCTFTSLVASCAMHGLDPACYMRDLFRVLPYWPVARLLELSPRDWPATRARLNIDELVLPIGPLTVPPRLPPP